MAENGPAHLRRWHWEPGQSGNPGGRPKGRTLVEAIKAELGRPNPADPEGRTWREFVAWRLVQLAMAGDMQAMQLLLLYDAGRPREQPPAEDLERTTWVKVLPREQLRVLRGGGDAGAPPNSGEPDADN